MDVVKALLADGANVNAKTTSGLTVLNSAALTGNVDLVKELLSHGAEPGGAKLPEPLTSLKGKSVFINVRNDKLSNVLKRLGRTASLDGYTINAGANMDQKATMRAKAPWTEVLGDLAAKHHLFLIVKGKEIYAFRYGK